MGGFLGACDSRAFLKPALSCGFAGEMACLLTLIKDYCFKCAAGDRLLFAQEHNLTQCPVNWSQSPLIKFLVSQKTMRLHPSKRSNPGRKTTQISVFSGQQRGSQSTQSDDDSGKFRLFPPIVEHVLVDTPTVTLSEWSVVLGVDHSS